MTSTSLVIGYGNPLRGDDGVGWDAALAVAARAPAGVRALTVPQLTPELAHELAGCERAVFIDACVDAAPGAVRVRPVRRGGTLVSGFTHHCEPPVLLALAAQVCGSAPAEAWLVTVGVEQLDCEECLSATVRHALPHVVDAVLGLLAQPHLAAAG